MRLLILVISLLASPIAASQSSCWVLTDLSGNGYSQSDGYRPEPDRISHSIRLMFDGNDTSASPGDLPMLQVDEFMAVAMGKTDAFSTVETYQVDPVLGIAIYTKAISGKSVFSGITGARAFTGKARRCNQ